MGRMSRQHLIEVGLALALTLAAFLVFAFAVWAKEPAGIAVSDAWARPTIGEGRVTAAYMTIKNGGSAEDVLLSATSPKAARVEIHETTMSDDGVMKMRPLADGLTIPGDGTATLKPGGAHVMVMGLDDALAEGAELPITLTFKEAGTMDITVPVASKPGDKDSGGHHHHH